MATCATWCRRKARSIPSNDFAMQYRVIERNEKHVEAIAKALQEGQRAVPGDRPGPRGRGHLLAPARAAEGTRRAQGQEGASRGVLRDHQERDPRGHRRSRATCRMDLVNAQQARRALDYLVGFNLSPLLWKKVRQGLSAGRVQSPALRMICERDEAIDAFMPQEYWTIDAEGEHSESRFPLKLIEYAGKKVEQFSFTNEGSAREVEATLQRAWRGGQLTVEHHRPQAAQAQSGAAVHHLDAAAGSRAQARLLRAAHHAPGAAAVRRRRLRRRRRRPHHLHAHRLGVAGQRGRHRDPRHHREALRQGRPGRGAARLQDQVEERPGSARGRAPHLGRDHAGSRSKARSTPTSSSSTR